MFYVQMFPNFLSNEECDRLIQFIDANHSRSLVSNSSTEKSVVEDTRTSSTCNLNGEDPFIKGIHERIATTLNEQVGKGETLQGQMYEVGQYFRPHTDAFGLESYKQHCQSSGNRTKTFMIYLNEPEEGGETNFPEVDIKVSPKKGMAVSWNSLEEGQILKESLHEGCDVLKGTKYIITSWWRENIWNPSKDSMVKETANTFSNKENFPKFTEKGFKVVDVPSECWEIVQNAYKQLKDRKVEESFNGKDSIIPGEGNTSDIMSFDYLPAERVRLHELLKPVHEEFINNSNIEPSFIYGIRSYNKGATLAPHVDRIETHHISSIIIVDKDLDGKKDWPLDIQDHNGNWHKIYAKPGQMILYESAVCEHARIEKFEGNWFRNFFVHYKLTDWEYAPE